MYKRLSTLKLLTVPRRMLLRLDNNSEGGDCSRVNSLEDRDSTDENCFVEDPNLEAVNAKVLRTDAEIVAAAANRHNDVFTIFLPK
jgi:hypothetical protein